MYQVEIQHTTPNFGVQMNLKERVLQYIFSGIVVMKKYKELLRDVTE
jgi:hypothetical protein